MPTPANLTLNLAYTDEGTQKQITGVVQVADVPVFGTPPFTVNPDPVIPAQVATLALNVLNLGSHTPVITGDVGGVPLVQTGPTTATFTIPQP